MAKRSRNQSALHGILVVDKPGAQTARADGQPGGDDTGDTATRLPTSHDIVQKVRRWSGQRRIGHTGTLDPMASGVLVLCLGLATRLVEYYQGHDKRYYAEIGLGTATDTYDATGTVMAEGALPELSPDLVEAALERFRGPVAQVPPAFSALKQGGESMHRRARRGETVEMAPRPVVFHSLDLVEIIAPDRIALRAHCSAGTYIRSLAYDLGQTLGVPAHLAELRREAAGPFTLEDAHTPAAIEAAAQAGHLAELLQPVGARLDLPRYTLDEGASRAFGYGQSVQLSGGAADSANADEDATATPAVLLAQAYGEDGRFLGIIRRLGEAGDAASLWKAEKWLVVDGESI